MTGNDIVPTEGMAATLRVMDYDYAMEVDPRTRYGAATARFLRDQLPGRDMRNVGWGLLLVAAGITPDRDRSSAITTAMRSILLSAGQVGAALIDSEPPALAQRPCTDVGHELAELRPMAADMAHELSGLFPPAMLDSAEASSKTLEALEQFFPEADVPSAGWAALGTGMILARNTRSVYMKARRGIMRPRTRQEREHRGQGGMVAALFLASVGGSLISL